MMEAAKNAPPIWLQIPTAAATVLIGRHSAFCASVAVAVPHNGFDIELWDVHRIDPGSAYTVDGCVTLCRVCHGDKPKSRNGEGRGAFLVRIPLSYMLAVRKAADSLRRTSTSIIQEALEKHLANNGLWPPTGKADKPKRGK